MLQVCNAINVYDAIKFPQIYFRRKWRKDKRLLRQLRKGNPKFLAWRKACPDLEARVVPLPAPTGGENRHQFFWRIDILLKY
ncbi:hypothetical protein E2986_10771 [Frieseomelitta varia]|uniref:Uncharacterized protein n=1 Tax=Frieseomelitta varia TaxID=561572 RepID=A0A833SHH1_9HYME|nr:hypothetical protein E2986_10771 [Frieseomelitta varia]